ncbi:MAG: 6-phosphofructokinase, partial [Candidatus Omnitrophica bacterium]|nr:6-phosphofructokinase [Candidatus Omnitrophota bacterium]
VTVVGVNRGKIQYLETKKVIKQRYVDAGMISFYERLGINFGRRPENKEMETEEKKGKIERIM